MRGRCYFGREAEQRWGFSRIFGEAVCTEGGPSLNRYADQVALAQPQAVDGRFHGALVQAELLRDFGVGRRALVVGEERS